MVSLSSFFYLSFKIVKKDNPLRNLSRNDEYKVELRSNDPDYKLVKSDGFDGFLEYLDNISFWQEGVYDYERNTQVRVNKLIIYLSDKPGLSDRVRDVKEGIERSSFSYEVTGEDVVVYIYTNIDGVAKLDLDRDSVFNQALMRAVYFITKKDSGSRFVNYLEEVTNKIRDFYKVPYINLVNVDSS